MASTGAAPDDELFRFSIDEIQEVDVHLMGRRLYETMLYWENPDDNPSLDDAELEWAALWNPLPKVVFSTTLSSVEGNARLASGSLAEEIERLRAEPGEGDIAIGGATLAAEADGLGLIDEYHLRVFPVLVGGGIPYFSQQRASGGSRTRRDSHLSLESRLPALPRGALALVNGQIASNGSPSRAIDGRPSGPAARRPPASPGTTGGRARWSGRTGPGARWTGCPRTRCCPAPT